MVLAAREAERAIITERDEFVPVTLTPEERQAYLAACRKTARIGGAWLAAKVLETSPGELRWVLVVSAKWYRKIEQKTLQAIVDALPAHRQVPSRCAAADQVSGGVKSGVRRLGMGGRPLQGKNCQVSRGGRRA